MLLLPVAVLRLCMIVHECLIAYVCVYLNVFVCAYVCVCEGLRVCVCAWGERGRVYKSMYVCGGCASVSRACACA